MNSTPAASEGGDGEPTLGATTAINQERAWQAHADAWGACDEAEPYLGWTGHGYGHPQSVTRGYDRELEENSAPMAANMTTPRSPVAATWME